MRCGWVSSASVWEAALLYTRALRGKEQKAGSFSARAEPARAQVLRKQLWTFLPARWVRIARCKECTLVMVRLTEFNPIHGTVVSQQG